MPLSRGAGVPVLRLMAESAKSELLVQAEPGRVGEQGSALRWWSLDDIVGGSRVQAIFEKDVRPRPFFYRSIYGVVGKSELWLSEWKRDSERRWPERMWLLCGGWCSSHVRRRRPGSKNL